MKNWPGPKGPAGLVPTMGALHDGHLSLIARSISENELTICSIFVNPTQFTDPEDLKNYPRPVERDLEKLQKSGCNVLFMPDVSEIYPHEENSHEENWSIDLGGLDNLMEGKFRPGHYKGVTQVVKKLFDLVKPTNAYFGQKDYQQFLVIKYMVEQLSVPVELICCPTVREDDGLAMSSRNVHLSESERKAAALLSKVLFLIPETAKRMNPQQSREAALELLSSSSLIEVEYLEIADARNLRKIDDWNDASSVIALVAAKVGQTRLIDNLLIR